MTDSSTRSPWILPLNSDQADLPSAGGKGANLARLVLAGFPVPDGFIIATPAYRAFVSTNHLEQVILETVVGSDSSGTDGFEKASQLIRAVFANAIIPIEIEQAILNAYAHYSRFAVAVRSSATAEDLPEMSFAGQQDTFLNVVGSDTLLEAIVQCWSSLWTARAIAYRTRNQVGHEGVTLAVIVQAMVESQASGVLFTANPLTGLRSETVIDATLGLGEALVSGQVEPDHYVVDPAQGRILSKALGRKTVAIHGKAGGGTQTREQNRAALQALPDEQILALANLGKQIADHFGSPQDIEWAWADHRLYLLQSRPVTALYPLPTNLPAEPLKVLFSFGAVQGMLDPLTPLGCDVLRENFAIGAGLFGIHLTRATQTVVYEAGGRLWINFTPVISNSIGRRIIPTVLGMVEPTIRQAVETIWNDPRLIPGKPGISLRARLRLARFFIPMAANVLMNLVAPRKRREFIVQNGEIILKGMEQSCSAIHGDRWERLAQHVNLLSGQNSAFIPSILILFVSGVAAGMASWNLLNMLVTRAVAGQSTEQQSKIRDLVLQVTRGMPYNPTTEMDLALWDMAKTIRHDPLSWQVFQICSSSELTTRYQRGGLPEASQKAVSRFLGKYGGRGLGEIDLGRTRWAEDPTHVFEMVGSFLQIEDETKAPDVVFSRGVDIAKQAVNELAGMVRKTSYGWLKARLVFFLAGRARQWMGAREAPKFFAVRMMGLLQRELQQTGRAFVQADEMDSPDDLLYLSLDELQDFTYQNIIYTRHLIADHRESYRRELQRRQIPRLLLSDGRAFYEGMSMPDKTGNTLSGSPVSPGSARGRVRVVLDPRQAHLQPGEILVCPGTDPSWTPLFLSAGGLVMETGGMMTHGAVVAREYGIPAIVGVDRATLRLQTGQLIRVNGSSGQIEILET